MSVLHTTGPITPHLLWHKAAISIIVVLHYARTLTPVFWNTDFHAFRGDSQVPGKVPQILLGVSVPYWVLLPSSMRLS